MLLFRNNYIINFINSEIKKKLIWELQPEFLFVP